MEIKIEIDDNELEKLVQMGLIDKADEEEIVTVIHDLIYQHYELQR